MATIYGIKNCDTVKKALRWLDKKQIQYCFHDFRVNGLTREQLQSWIDEFGWESLVNKRSTTWRLLPDKDKSQINAQLAKQLMFSSPTLIKRPILEVDKRRLLGFSETAYQEFFTKHRLILQ